MARAPPGRQTTAREQFRVALALARNPIRSNRQSRCRGRSAILGSRRGENNPWPGPMTSVDSAVARLTALHPKLIDLSLDRMWRVLAALGHPERSLPPVIHVAGTNGKGSTIAFMRAILEAAGLRVHVYTSPHLVRFNERFRLGRKGEGVLVSDGKLGAAFEECERANAGAPITVFEITTAAGLLLFSRHPADVLLLEVGLGGRLDATNVIERPLATIVTPVSFDHADFLGDSVAKIAAEK